MKLTGKTKVWVRTTLFPAKSAGDVAVVLDENATVECWPDGPFFKSVQCGTEDMTELELDENSTEIDVSCYFGLDGWLSDIPRICNAMWTVKALHDEIGLPIEKPDHLWAWWPKESLDGHDEDMAEELFHTIREVYGAEAEASARAVYNGSLVLG